MASTYQVSFLVFCWLVAQTISTDILAVLITLIEATTIRRRHASINTYIRHFRIAYRTIGSFVEFVHFVISKRRKPPVGGLHVNTKQQ